MSDPAQQSSLQAPEFWILPASGHKLHAQVSEKRTALGHTVRVMACGLEDWNQGHWFRSSEHRELPWDECKRCVKKVGRRGE